MNQNEIKFLNLENELLSTRKRLNDLIYEYSQTDQASPETANTALYQDKINYLETELKYLGNQLQILKNMQSIQNVQSVQIPQPVQKPQESQPVQNVQSVQIPPSASKPQEPQPVQNAQSVQIPPSVQKPQELQPVQNSQSADSGIDRLKTIQEENFRWPKEPDTIQDYIARINYERKPRDYEKLFGRNFMGIFASVLIFISLIIFATLIIPHLTDIMKMTGMYLVSFGVLFAGYALYRKNNQNNFYIALIGCGAGSLYLSLLLSNLYFRLLEDVPLYLLILVWTVFVKYLTRIKNFVFTIIGQCGIFIAMVLGTLLCVTEEDSGMFLVLIIFYMISSFVFSNLSKAYLRFLANSRRSNASEKTDAEIFYYEDSLSSHICKFLNATVITLGLNMMPVKWDALKITCVIFMMLYLLVEFYIAYKEECRHGLVFQILTIADSFLFICLFDAVNFYAMDATYLLMYLVSLALLFYVNKKGERAGFKIVSEIYCVIMIYLGCSLNPFIREHLYAYLTVIPFMLYGILRRKRFYLYTSILYIAQFLFLIMSLSSTYFLKTELFIMILISYAVFLFSCNKTGETWFKIAGYLVLCIITILGVDDYAHQVMIQFMIKTNEIPSGIAADMGAKAHVIAFITVTVIHLILFKLNYFGKEPLIEKVMFGVTVLLMIMGYSCISGQVWEIPAILFTILLFLYTTLWLRYKYKQGDNYEENKIFYLIASGIYIGEFLYLILAISDNYMLRIEYFILIIIAYAAFLYICKDMKQLWLRMAGYLILCTVTLIGTQWIVRQMLHDYNMTHTDDIWQTGTKAYLIAFSLVTMMHLILNRLKYLGKEKPIEIMMFVINTLFMIMGSNAILLANWKLPIILVTVLLFYHITIWLYDGYKNEEVYAQNKVLYPIAGTVYVAEFLLLISSIAANYVFRIEYFILIIAAYAAFLFVIRKLKQNWLRVVGYLVLCSVTMLSVESIVRQMLNDYNMTHSNTIGQTGNKAYLIAFSLVALMHLILNKLKYFGEEKSIEIMMYLVNAVLMIMGTNAIYLSEWKLPIILIAVLLFFLNSKKLLTKHKYAGYYIAIKYTVLLICILDSFDVVNYIISISLLLFAIVSIIAGFYINNTSFRLYGLVLSMISIFKLIMIDIKYDSTIENAVSFFVSGVLCFIISFIYNKIDTNFKKGTPSDSGSEE